MQKFFWLCLGSIIFGLLIRIPFAGGGILFSDILVPLFAVLYLGQKILTREKFPTQTLFLPGFLFLGWAFITWILGAWDLDVQEKILSFSYLVRFFSILILGIATSDFWETSEPFRQTFWRNIWIVAGIIVGFGFLQFYLIPDIGKFSTEGGFDPHIGRFLGTWMDPNFVGGFLAFLLPILVGQVYKSRLKGRKSGLILKVLLVLIFTYALFLTFSRSAYLGAGAGLFFFFLFRDPKIILIGILIGTMGIFSNERALKRVTELGGTMSAVIFQNADEIDATASLRVESWRKSFELFEKYPVFGIGYNTYRFRAAEEGVVDENYFSAGGSDSTFLTVLVTTGIFGFLLFLYFYAHIWILFFFQFLRTKEPKLLGFVAGLSALFIHSFFVNSFLFPHIFMVVMVVGSVLWRNYRPQP